MSATTAPHQTPTPPTEPATSSRVPRGVPTSHTAVRLGGPTPPRPPAGRAPAAPMGFGRILAVELRKMFDTRSGFWLLVGIVAAATLATGAVVLWAPDENLTYNSFGSAVGIPMAVLLPVVAILSVTSEWTQRTGLTTFTLVPHRGRVILAKALGAVVVGVVSMLVAFVVGALGNIVGSTIAGVDTVWDVSATALALIVLGNVLGLLVGFMLGLLVRSSAAAVVAYFVYSFVLTGLFSLLAASQQWFADLQPWVDYSHAQAPLFEGSVSGQEWVQLAVTTVMWLVVPIGVGLLALRRAEVR